MWMAIFTAMALGASSDAVRWNAEGNAAYAQGEFDAAEKAFERALRVADERDQPGILSNLAATDKRTGNFRRALRRYETVIELRARLLGDAHPESGLARNNAAEMLRLLGRSPEALAMSRAALQSNLTRADRAVVMNNYASLLEANRQVEEARAAFWVAIALHDGADQPVELATALTNLGALELRAENIGEARRLHGRALALLEENGLLRTPVAGGVLHNVALTEFRAGDVREAVSRIRSAVELSSRGAAAAMQRAVILANAATILQHAGQKSKARRARERSWSLMPAEIKWTVSAADLIYGTRTVEPSPRQ